MAGPAQRDGQERWATHDYLLNDLCVDRLTRLRHEHDLLAEPTTFKRLRQQVVGHRNLVDRVTVDPMDPVRPQLCLPTVHRLCKQSSDVTTAFPAFQENKIPRHFPRWIFQIPG